MILGVADHPSFKTTLEEFLNFASDVEVEVIEVRLDKIELLSTLYSPSSRKDRIKKLLDCYDFKYFVHAPCIGVNLASLNPSLRRASEKTVVKAVKFAYEIDAELLVTHVGRLSRDYPPEFIEKSMDNAIGSLKRINTLSENFRVTFTIENDHKAKDHVLAGDIWQITHLIEKVGCKLTFDVGHANTFGKPEEFACSLKNHIVNIHLHDNNGQEDSHLPLGKGKINFKEIIEEVVVYADLPLIFECHSLEGLKESLNFAKQNLIHLL